MPLAVIFIPTSLPEVGDDFGVGARLFIGLNLVLFGCSFWIQAGPFASANRPQWAKERLQVDAWWQVLTSPERVEGTIKFSTPSFFASRYTYRLLGSGPIWAVARSWNRLGRVQRGLRV
jgi:hypothetical protein